MSMDPDPTSGRTETPSSPPSYETPPSTALDAPGTAPAPSDRPTFGPTNGYAIAALVLGIVGLVGFPLIPSILALIFGYKGKREIDNSNGYQQGRGMAIAGIVLGWIAIAIALLLIVFVLVPLVGLGVLSELGP